MAVLNLIIFKDTKLKSKFQFYLFHKTKH